MSAVEKYSLEVCLLFSLYKYLTKLVLCYILLFSLRLRGNATLKSDFILKA